MKKEHGYLLLFAAVLIIYFAWVHYGNTLKALGRSTEGAGITNTGTPRQESTGG